MLPIKIPSVGESISEVVLARWLKKNGDYVQRDEPIAELESEKATFELNAEQAGVLSINGEEGTTFNIGDTLGSIDTAAPALASAPAPSAPASSSAPAPIPATQHKVTPSPLKEEKISATPLASKIMEVEKVAHQSLSEVKGKLHKNDILKILAQQAGGKAGSREGKREKLSQLRKVIARRLVEAKNMTAMLTTFNEVDMSAIMDVRKRYKEAFHKTHGVNLGFMSFFTKACCVALEELPSVNAYIDGEHIIYHQYCDISIAVSTPKGLVVPVIRNAESLSMAGIEKKVVELATKARENKLTIEEMTGGTFTITNGGVFGSLMSTPIINIPQSAILGMHKIQERPIAVNGQVVVRPMMYVALSYDHRIIDGKESVGFLVRVKELLENPELLFTRKKAMDYLLEL